MRFSRSTRTICEGCECRKNGKVQQSYFMRQKLAKARQTCSEVRKRRQSLAGVVFSSAGRISIFFWNFLRTSSAFRVVFYSQFLLKHVLKLRHMRRTYSRRARCSQSLRKSPNQITTFCRMSRASSEVLPWFKEHSRCSHISRVFFVYVDWP